MFFNHVKEKVNKYKILSNEGNKDSWQDLEIVTSITEFDFYRSYLSIKGGLSQFAHGGKPITKINIDYMALIMCQPLEFTLPAMSKSNIQTRLAAELNKTPKSAYSAINRLKSLGYLVVTEDGLIEPNRELQQLRNVTKSHLSIQDGFPIAYTLEFIVSNNEKHIREG